VSIHAPRSTAPSCRWASIRPLNRSKLTRISSSCPRLRSGEHLSPSNVVGDLVRDLLDPALRGISRSCRGLRAPYGSYQGKVFPCRTPSKNSGRVATVICSRGLYTPIYRTWARPSATDPPADPPPIRVGFFDAAQTSSLRSIEYRQRNAETSCFDANVPRSVRHHGRATLRTASNHAKRKQAAPRKS
jgi:hypothetical protein